MPIRIGASCVSKFGRYTHDVTVCEIRNIVGEENRFWNDVRDCLNHNIYVIVNIDMWKDGGHYRPNEKDWRIRVDSIVSIMMAFDPTATKWRITIENEPMKYHSKEKYAWYVNLAYDQIKNKRGYRQVLIGAGNEEYDLAIAKDNMYEYICQYCNFDILDIHIQSSCISPDSIEAKCNFWKDLASRYKKRISCTEANWFDVATSNGYGMLLKQLIKAEEIGCEDFCMVFIALNSLNNYRWLSFIYDNKCRNWNNWLDFIRIINEKKPKPKPKPIGDDDMKLTNLKRGSKGNQVLWLQEVLELEYGFENEGGFDGIFGAKTEAQVKEYQRANGLIVDGIVGKQTTADLINNSGNPNYWMRKLQIYMAFE